jgi:holo-[acyl-carrier protein] synthase
MIGIDIVKIERFENFLKKENSLQKYLCDEEIKLITSPQSAAGFFAAKEAISKALKTGIGKECSFKDIKIHKTEKNAPYFTLKKEIVEKFHIKNTSLSITHDGGFAIAVAYIEYDTSFNLPISH